MRYRLCKDEILACCDEGYSLGFRTFVLQGGEDPYYTDDRVCEIVSAIRAGYPDCAITLSIGEKPRESYQAFFDAGANRYLLRHETADGQHYGKLHPAEYNRVVPIRYLEKTERDVYAFGPVESREAVLLFNEQTVLTAEQTVEYMI